MSFANKFNDASPVFDFKASDNAPYLKPSELLENDGEGSVYVIKAVYINTKGKFGPSPIIACEKFMVNAPQHLVEDVEAMREDADTIAVINAGKAGFKLYKYTNKFGEQIGLTWVDVE